jgi:hypothetical protein
MLDWRQVLSSALSPFCRRSPALASASLGGMKKQAFQDSPLDREERIVKRTSSIDVFQSLLSSAIHIALALGCFDV